MRPRPADDVSPAIPAEHAADGIPITVPQLLSSDGTSDRAPDQSPHHGGPGEIEAHHRVGGGPHEVPNAAVVAVDYPAVVPMQFVGDARTELVDWQLGPAGLVEDGVQLDVGDTQPGGEPAAERGLSGTRVPHDRHPIHPAIVAPSSPLAAPNKPQGTHISVVDRPISGDRGPPDTAGFRSCQP